MDKYKLVPAGIGSLFRVVALKNIETPVGFPNVVKNDLGGLVSSKTSLSQEGNCWVFYTAKVVDNGRVRDNAIISGTAKVKDNSIIKDEAIVDDCAIVGDNAIVQDSAKVVNAAIITGNSVISDLAVISDKAVVTDDSHVSGASTVKDSAIVAGQSFIGSNAKIKGYAHIKDSSVAGSVLDFANITNGAEIAEDAEIGGHTVIDGSIVIPKKAKLTNCIISDKNFFNNDRISIAMPMPSTFFSKQNFENLVTKIIPINFYMHPKETTFFLEYTNKYTKEIKILDFYSPRHYMAFPCVINEYADALLCAKNSFNELYEKEKFSDKTMNVLYDILEDMDLEEETKNMGEKLIAVIKDNSTSAERESLNECPSIGPLVQKYIFAQFFGLFLYGIDACYCFNPDEYFLNTSADYKKFITSIINSGSINLKDKTFSWDEVDFAYNDEIINAIKKICVLSDDWAKRIKSELSNPKYNSINLYVCPM